MSTISTTKYFWDDAASAAPYWKIFVRNHTTELQRKEIAFVNNSVYCDTINLQDNDELYR
jgi:hypothetical protein